MLRVPKCSWVKISSFIHPSTDVTHVRHKHNMRPRNPNQTVRYNIYIMAQTMMSTACFLRARPAAAFTQRSRTQRTPARLLRPVRAGNPFVGETNDPEKTKQRKEEKVRCIFRDLASRLTAQADPSHRAIHCGKCG